MASVEVPKKHKALVYDKPGSISTKIEEVDTPEPGVGEVLVNLQVSAPPLPKSDLLTSPSSTHSGVCHSDMGVMTQSVCLPSSDHAMTPGRLSLLFGTAVEPRAYVF